MCIVRPLRTYANKSALVSDSVAGGRVSRVPVATVGWGSVRRFIRCRHHRVDRLQRGLTFGGANGWPATTLGNAGGPAIAHLAVGPHCTMSFMLEVYYRS